MFSKKKKKDSDTVPDMPKLDLALTLSIAAMFAFITKSFVQHEDSSVILEFGISLGVTFILIFLCKATLKPVGHVLSTAESLKKPRNIRKFSDQGWQLVVHAAMTWYEYRLLQANGWRWWSEPASLWNNSWQSEKDGVVGDTTGSCPSELRLLYIAQMGIWFVTAFSHKFIEAKHKDYFVMYGHHVATLGLVSISYLNGWEPIGLVVLFIHDSSDIVVDVLKMVNYLGLDADSGLFLAEGVFVLNLVTWAATRLWLYPSIAVRNAFYSIGSYPVVDNSMPRTACRAFLCVLYLMHCWWYYLFLRIAWKLIRGNTGHDAGRDYEGSSDSEGDSGTQVKTNGKKDS